MNLKTKIWSHKETHLETVCSEVEYIFTV